VHSLTLVGADHAPRTQIGGQPRIGVSLVAKVLTTIDFAFVAVESPRIARRFVAAPPAAQSALLLQGIPLLVDISVGLGGILVAPVWSFWFGWGLHRMVEKEIGT
jgi:hypothetical protein